MTNAQTHADALTSENSNLRNQFFALAFYQQTPLIETVITPKPDNSTNPDNSPVAVLWTLTTVLFVNIVKPFISRIQILGM
ncbi:MAG TPA: hypothetical protein PK299_14965 [Anaerolineales bacterium]|nr:hypothetical protein [Anaerolineales bacterium]